MSLTNDEKAFLAAAKDGDISTIRKLLSKNVNINIQDVS
jgi:hypothetical protein